MRIERRKTRMVMVGNVEVGGSAPVSVQSMTNTRTCDVEETVAQIKGLAGAGCEIARVAVPDGESVSALREVISLSPIPVVADIHFDYRLAIGSVGAGAHAIRINPGNIGSEERTRAVVDAAGSAGVPIRIGVNAGSLEKDILEHDGRPTASGLVESAMRHVSLVETMGFTDIVLSLKASDVAMTIDANRAVAALCDCPLHLGITEAGTVLSGAVRSAVGLGILLAEGIGDTIRVSLAGSPELEVTVGRRILSSLSLARGGVTIIACPTCGRSSIDVAAIADEIERRTSHIRSPMTVAVMGCAVNGPGEAREADIGIAGGGRDVVLFCRGQVKARLDEAQAVDTLLAEISKRAGTE